jgi:hypothetical protein
VAQLRLAYQRQVAAGEQATSQTILTSQENSTTDSHEGC